MRKATLGLGAVAVMAAAGLAIVKRRELGGSLLEQEPRRRNLLLVSIDTMRADRLGCYGYAGAATPRLDALAASGLRFAQTTTVTPLTLPAHASLLTGTFPGRHGVRDNGGFYLGDEQTTLAEVLRAAGYRTGGFVGAFVLDSRWGIHQGFDHYFDSFELSKHEGMGMDAVQRRGDTVVEHAQAWLDKDPGKPFFAFVHLYDPHTPYDAPEPYRSSFPATPSGAYDAEVAFTDSLIGRLLDHLQARGRLDDTVIVVVGDHGESLGEHQEHGHGFFVYDTTVQIPLIVSGPGVPRGTVSEQVRIVDVMPTALELLGRQPPASVQGRSLLPLARGERLDLLALSETWFPRFHYGWSELVSIRDGRYKLIAAPRRELYDLKDDPAETHDLSTVDPERARRLEDALAEMRSRLESSSAKKGPEPVDAEVEERLFALGYIGGTSTQDRLAERPRGDPKDKIALYNALKAAAQSSVEDRIPAAITQAQEVLTADPEIVEGHMLLGNFLSKAHRYEEAVEAYRKALGLDSQHQGAAFSLALAYKNLGRFEDAEAGFERVRQLDSRNTRALWQLADLWIRRGKFDQAEGLLKEGLAKKADRPTFLLRLGACYIEMRRFAEAEAVLGEALKLKADLPGAHYNLALVHEAQGEIESAMVEYEAEVAGHPGAYRASFNLGKLLLERNRTHEALQRFQEATASNPAFGAGYLYLAKALFDIGDLKAAAEAARKGLASDPERKVAPLGHYVLADVYSRLGRKRDAAREVAAARRIEKGG